MAFIVPLGRVLAGSFLPLNVALVAVRRDLSMRDEPISAYLKGTSRPLAVVAFAALAAGVALLAVAWQSTAHPARARVAPLLWVYAAGVALAAATEPSSHVHGAGALAAFAAVPLAVVLSSTPRRLMWFGAMIASFAAWPVLGLGLGERLTVILELTWILCLSVPAASPRLAHARIEPRKNAP